MGGLFFVAALRRGSSGALHLALFSNGWDFISKRHWANVFVPRDTWDSPLPRTCTASRP